jgi:hypothetical protein
LPALYKIFITMIGCTFVLCNFVNQLENQVIIIFLSENP